MVEISRFTQLTKPQILFIMLLVFGILLLLIPIQAKRTIKFPDGCVETYYNNEIAGEYCNISRNKLEARKSLHPVGRQPYIDNLSNISLQFILNLTR